MRPAAEIDGRDGQRLVHRHDEVARAVDAAPRAERLAHRLAERDADVFDGVVLVHVEVAVHLQRQVERAVPRDQLQHVIEEADAGRDRRSGRAPRCRASARIDVSRVCAIDHRAAHRTSSSAAIARRVSSTSPAVMRMHCPQPGSLRTIADPHAARAPEPSTTAAARSPTRTSTKLAALGQVCRPSRAHASVEQRPRGRRLFEIPVAIGAILDRDRQRRGGPRVHAVGRDDPAQRRERERERRRATPTRSPARP